jgi:hypothetical protein
MFIVDPTHHIYIYIYISHIHIGKISINVFLYGRIVQVSIIVLIPGML